jgi:hypothetical protein
MSVLCRFCNIKMSKASSPTTDIYECGKCYALKKFPYQNTTDIGFEIIEPDDDNHSLRIDYSNNTIYFFNYNSYSKIMIVENDECHFKEIIALPAKELLEKAFKIKSLKNIFK